jgi:GT2 family glycosyltransferase
LGDLSKSPQAYRPKNPTLVNHLATTNALFVKSALVRIGGFSAKFAACGEDLDLGLRLTEKNFQLFLLPEPVVINHCAKNFGEWLTRMFRFGKAQAHLFLLRGFKKPLPVAPLLLMPVLLLSIIIGFFPEIPIVPESVTFLKFQPKFSKRYVELKKAA